jgi:hypothetical protein
LQKKCTPGGKPEARSDWAFDPEPDQATRQSTTPGPQPPKYVSAAFGFLDTPWKPGDLALEPTVLEQLRRFHMNGGSITK